MTMRSSHNNSSSNLSVGVSATGSSKLGRLFPRGIFKRSNSSSTSVSSHRYHRKSDTEFFASLESNNDLAFFRRSEVEAGNLLGEGTFASIHAVTAIRCCSADDDTMNRTAAQTQRRQEIQSTVKGCGRRSSPRYAIKQLTPRTVKESDPKTLAKAARELVNDAKFLARLSGHPNIVTLRGLTVDAFGRNYLASRYDDFFVLMDRVSNDTLADRIYKDWRKHPSRGSEPEEDLIPLKANYAFQIAKALRHCHQNGVLYRDLKPGNIGFSRSDPHTVQLLDFGLAREFPPSSVDVADLKQQGDVITNMNNSVLYGDDATYRVTLAGTRRYLAGEVLVTGEYSWKSDVYSWAMVYYEMCTERKPYQGLSAADHQTLVCEQGERPSLEDTYLPEVLDFIFHNAWNPQLSNRSSMDEVCDQMQTFLMHLDIAYYEQKEGEFLFDVEIQETTDVEELENDEDWNMGQRLLGTRRAVSSSSSMMMTFMASIDDSSSAFGGDDDSDEYDDERMKTSFKSMESDDTYGAQDPTSEAQNPRKIISSAA